jgi:hypothetical protein
MNTLQRVWDALKEAPSEGASSLFPVQPYEAMNLDVIHFTFPDVEIEIHEKVTVTERHYVIRPSQHWWTI